MNKLKEIIANLKDLFDKEKKEREEKRKRLIIALTVFFVCLVIVFLLVIPVLTYEYLYQNKIYTGLYIDSINFSGLTQEQALTKINQHIDNLRNGGLNFKYNENFNVGFTVVSPQDPDLAFPLLNFETEKMVSQAYKYGRTADWLTNLNNQLRAILYNQEIPLQYNLNEKELKSILQEKFSKYEKPAQNAGLKFSAETNYEITPEQSGFIINYDQAVNELKADLNLISINTITLQTSPSISEVSNAEAIRARPLVDEVLKREKLIFYYEKQQWEILRQEFKDWLAFSKDNNQVALVFKEDKLTDKLNQLAVEINLEPQDAKLTMENGKVKEFITHKNGLTLNIEKNIAKINQEFFHDNWKDNKTEITLTVDITEPQVLTSDVNGFGIKEIIGVGESDFSGSSSNRIKNITNAASILHGMLIEPGKEFSLVDAIGEVDAASGFVPEYVIKGDRTIPEFGGGLCQIATTTFRVALWTGLPITERKPHSYMVSYYDPQGMDAAIYGPHPDVRFINDTGHYILFQTAIEGKKLTFTFWGQSDGRQVELTEPEVYNYRGAGAPKYIENPNLAPGEKKLIERARSGADAHFYRYITRPGQAKEEEIWRSHYSAWSAIYEIGVGAEETQTDNQSADQVIEEPVSEPEAEATPE